MGGLDPPIQCHKTRFVPSGFVYMLASERNGTLYIGVTSYLPDRLEQHRRGEGSQFVKKYGVTQLVWFEEYPLYADAFDARRR
jgi:putative endonuclease